MFIELFQTIYNHIGEFLLSLGLSAGTIYLIVRVIKGLVYIIFQKKKRQLAKKQDNEDVATLTANKIFEHYDPIFKKTNEDLQKLSNDVEEIKTQLSKQDNRQIEELSIEVRAYEQVMLSQDNDLQLQFEQIKANLINASKAKDTIKDVAETTTTIANNLTDAIASNEEQLVEAAESVGKTVKKVKTTAKKMKNKAKTVVYD